MLSVIAIKFIKIKKIVEQM